MMKRIEILDEDKPFTPFVLSEKEEYINILKSLIKQKYGRGEGKWLKTLTNKQLEFLSLSILTVDPFEEFKDKIAV